MFHVEQFAGGGELFHVEQHKNAFPRTLVPLRGGVKLFDLLAAIC